MKRVHHMKWAWRWTVPPTGMNVNVLRQYDASMTSVLR